MADEMRISDCGSDVCSSDLPAYAAKTWRSLASDWACFARWCAENAEAAFPAGPATVIAYLEAQASDHSLATLKRRLAILSHLHDALRAPNPAREPQVRRVLHGLARPKGSYPRSEEHTSELQSLMRI